MLLAQQYYISANYTHVSSYHPGVQGLNVVTHWSPNVRGRWRRALQRLELHNTDTTLDNGAPAPKRRASFKLGRAGQFRTAVHAGPEATRRRMEFSPVPATVPIPISRCLRRRRLSLSRVSDSAQHAIGLHAAGLVPDGGTLQIGIGQVGDALAQA